MQQTASPTFAQQIHCPLNLGSAHCLKLSTVLTDQGYILLLFCHAFRWPRIHVILFCNLIGAARIQALKSKRFEPPMLPGSSIPRRVKRKWAWLQG